MTQKTFLLELPCVEHSESGDPGYAYIEISPEIEQTLNKSMEQAVEQGVEIKKHGYCLPTFVGENPSERQGGGEYQVTPFTVAACNLLVTDYDFYFEVRIRKNSDEIELPRITFKELAEKPYDSAAEKTALTLAFVAVWNGERKEFECQMNPLNGALELGVEAVPPEVGEHDKWVVAPDGSEFRVFHGQDSDRYFVAPYDLEYLLGVINAENPRPN
jgi:hypothetical protein